jgi:fimbrial chaperone protein
MDARNPLVIAAGLVALFALRVAGAGQFTIAPLRMDFAAATTTAALTVRNEEAAPVVVQAQGLAWSQEGGQDTLVPSRDLLISPAVFTMPPGGSQLVRVALRREPDPSRELSYRITLQEVPQPAAPGFTGLQVALRLSVPIFVAPTAPAAPGLVWSSTVGPDGRMSVIARNDGTAHARISRFSVKTQDGSATLLEQPGLAYVLPGASRQWSVENNTGAKAATLSTAGAGTSPAPGKYRLEGTADQGTFAMELGVVAPD